MKTAVVALATSDARQRELVALVADAIAMSGDGCTLLWILHDNATHDAREPPVVAPNVALRTTALAGSDLTEDRSALMSRIRADLTETLRDFALVYGLLSGHATLDAIRRRRLSGRPAPYFVTIVDALPGAAIGMPAAWDDGTITRRFGESYVLAHSDFVLYPVSISHGNPAGRGWSPPCASLEFVPTRPRLSALVSKVAATAARTISTRSAWPPRGRTDAAPAVTVCVRHVRASERLERVLQALTAQTEKCFAVRVVQAGPSVTAPATLARLAERYRRQHWDFPCAPRADPGQALARAIHNAAGEYLIFLDGHDFPAPCLVERLLDAAHWTDDDLIHVQSELACDAGLGPPAHADGRQRMAAPGGRHYSIDPVAALAGHGEAQPVFLLRRSVYLAVGGMPDMLMRGRERQALALQVVLGGYRTDVIPDVLNTRQSDKATLEGIGLWQSEGVRQVFDAQLGRLRLYSFGLTFEAAARQRAAAVRLVERRERELRQRFAVPAARDRLRLLMMISSWPNPPITGCLLRWWAMIRMLGQRHDLTLITFCSPHETANRQELSRYCRSVYAVAYGGERLPEAAELPFLVRERMTTSMRDAVRAVPSHLYDAALIEQIFLAPFRWEINAPAILGEHNIESRLLTQAARTRTHGPPTPGFVNPEQEAALLRSYEDRVWPQFDTRYAVNEAERQEIQQRAGHGRTILVENGTNPELWLPELRPDTDRIVFFGMLGYYPNTDAVLYFWSAIWPRLRQRHPALRMIVAGSAPTTELRALAREPGIILVEQPPDIRAVAAQASVSVVPLRIGSGTRLKILDAMALGLPVVSTSLGCDGLAVADGEHLLVRDDPEAFADAVSQLLADVTLWRRLRENGRALVAERYSWEKVLAPLEPALWSLAR
jgi:glycosyltransferase involved in cell wall biosynthesis